jgi:hypothetical protein
MTLAISFFDPSVDSEDAAYRGMAEMPGDLFGWESWRGVWGSDELRRRGSLFLVQLKDCDLYVQPAELGAFRAELEAVYSASRDIAEALKIGEDDLQFRIQNALRACESAQERGLGVCIS